MRQKELEKIKSKERKSTLFSIKKKRTNNALPQINNFVNSFAGASMLANNSNTNLNVTSLFQEHKYRYHKSFATINSIYTLNIVSENNNNTLNNNGNSTTNQASSNFAAEAALRKMIANRQKERKKSLQMESKTKITKVLFLNITQKILIIILFLFFISPLIDKDFYGKDKSNNYQLADYFHNKLQDFLAKEKAIFEYYLKDGTGCAARSYIEHSLVLLYAHNLTELYGKN
jgi:hypothetical protein